MQFIGLVSRAVSYLEYVQIVVICNEIKMPKQIKRMNSSTDAIKKKKTKKTMAMCRASCQTNLINM